MKVRLNLIILTAIITLAAILRFVQLETIPAVNADEAALGYNAFSLLKTGKDEFGTPWPLLFRSFDDYKPGIYVYILLPFVKFLGLNVWAVRLPGVLLSIVCVGMMYPFTKLILGKNYPHRETISLIAAFVLATNPWHIHFSRGAWETQVSTTFLLIGIYGLIRGLNKFIWQIIGVSFMVLSLYTYHSMRVVVPLIALVYTITYFKKHFNKLKYSLISVGVGLFLLIPFTIQLFSPQGISRAQGVSIFADSGPIWRANELRSFHQIPSPIWVKLLHNKATAYGLTFGQNYLSHFDGNFLFLNGDEIQRNKVPYFGQMLLITLPFVIIGIIPLIKKKIRQKAMLVSWLFIAPIPAALTFQSPHAVRAYSLTIPLSIIIALGIYFFFSKAKKYISSKIVYTLIVILFVWDISRYSINYHLLMVPRYPFSSQYGLQELVAWTQTLQDQYDRIWVTDRYDQPYILFLFYSQYPPEQFQAQAQLSSRDNFGFATVRNYDKFHFESVDIKNIKSNYPNQKILVVGTDEEIPNQDILKEIKNSDGQIIFQITQI